MRNIILPVIFITQFMMFSVSAATRYVPGQYSTIQAAIDACVNGDIVIVSPGTYYENVTIDHKNIVLTSEEPNDPNVVASTIIDGGAINSVIRVIDANATLQGLSVINGLAYDGGGIYCSTSRLYITNCIISENTTTDGPSDATGDAKNGGDGGGIYCYESAVEINGSTITNNTTGDGGEWRGNPAGNGGSGGGIYCQGAYITLSNSLIASNKTGKSGYYSDWEYEHGGHGGGVGCVDSQLQIAGCSIRENITGTHGRPASSTSKAINGFGGGIYALRSDLTIENSQIVKNATTGPPGSFGKNGGHGGGISLYSCSLTLTDTGIIENNTGNGGRISQESGNGGNGAGLFLSSCSQISISDCVIARNIAGSVVGGIAYAYGGNGGSGGAIYSYDSSPSINNCFVISNSCGNGGDAEAEPGDGGSAGGIYSSDTVTVVNCVIAKNNAGKGGDYYGPYRMRGGNGGNGAGIYSPSATIINSTIVQNVTGIGGSSLSGGPDGLDGAGGGIYTDSNSVIKNCILWENYQDELYPPDCNIVSYSNISGGVCAGSTGNISTLPLFVGPDVNDYHLLPGSPCINAGDPNYVAEPNETDLDGNPRVIDGRIDMGAYEYWPPLEAEMKFTPQTINLGGNGNCVKAHILLPEGLSVEDIDVDCPAVAGPMGTESQNMKVFENEQGRCVVECDFDRSAFCEAFTGSGSLEVTVTGMLKNGHEFTCCDTIKIIAPRKTENILHVRGCPPLYRLE